MIYMKRKINILMELLESIQINNMGRRLLEMCRSLNLIIVNVRFGKDKRIGKKNMQIFKYYRLHYHIE